MRELRYLALQSFSPILVVRPSDYDAIRASQFRDRLPQSPRRQQPAISPGIHGVNRDDIETARDAQILETVIEQANIRLEIVYCPARSGCAIGGADYCGLVKQFFGEQKRLVPG